LRDVGGVPPSALEDEEFFELLLPTLRADFAAFERYQYRPQPPLDIDIHAIVGQDDPYVPASVLQGWKQQTTGEFALRSFAGGHFFLRESDKVVNFVRDLALAAGPAPRT
jgi:medium-chain acyl-[acyl-carrier-protein] hydrolase